MSLCKLKRSTTHSELLLQAAEQFVPLLYDTHPDSVCTSDVFFLKGWAEKHAEVMKFRTVNNTN